MSAEVNEKSLDEGLAALGRRGPGVLRVVADASRSTLALFEPIAVAVALSC